MVPVHGASTLFLQPEEHAKEVRGRCSRRAYGERPLEGIVERFWRFGCDREVLTIYRRLTPREA